MSEELPVIRASDAEREQAVARLRDASVEGRLTLEEFTDRMTTAYDARTHAELEQLVRDLPERAVATAPAVRTAPARRWIISLMGNATRRGRWRVGERTFVISAMGNATVDLRDAILAGPEVSIHVLCTMGNTTIIVPDGVDVELSVIPIMGNRMDLTHSEFKQGAPLVRISGLVSMGNLFCNPTPELRGARAAAGVDRRGSCPVPRPTGNRCALAWKKAAWAFRSAAIPRISSAGCASSRSSRPRRCRRRSASSSRR